MAADWEVLSLVGLPDYLEVRNVFLAHLLHLVEVTVGRFQGH